MAGRLIDTVDQAAGQGPGTLPGMLKLRAMTPAELQAGGVVFEFSMNQFIAPADQVRVLIWRQL
jgi:hypothetical protein